MKTDKPRIYRYHFNENFEVSEPKEYVLLSDHTAAVEQLEQEIKLKDLQIAQLLASDTLKKANEHIEQLEQRVKITESEADRWKKHFESRTGTFEYMVNELSKAENQVVDLEQKLAAAEARVKELDTLIELKKH